MPDYVYNKFFGLVVDNQVDIIVNPPMNDDDIMEVQSISQNGSNNVNYTTITASADNQSGSDSDIKSTNLNYRFIKKDSKFYSFSTVQVILVV